MILNKWLLAIVATIPTASVQGPVHRPAMPAVEVTAIVNVAVIPMDAERILSDQTVLVQQGRITALGPADKVRVPSGAVRINGQGKYLMPGLADMHMHLGTAGNPGSVTDETEADAELERRKWLLLGYLANGVTTIRIMNGGPWHVRLRQRAAAGAILAPRIYTSGPVLGLNRLNSLLTSEAAAKLVADHQAAGYDFLKIRVDQPGFNAEAFDTLFAAAKRAKMRIVGHTPPGIGLERFVQAQPASIEHLAGYIPAISGTVLETDIKDLAQVDDSKLAELAAATQRAGVWNCPTQTIQKLVSPQWFKTGWEKHLALRGKIIKALHHAGAGLLLGTDATDNYKSPIARPPGESAHDELQSFVAAGLTPYQAIETGTKNPAVFLGTLDSAGTVEVGKRADLVLLEKNPLEDVRHTKSIAGVMLGGRWISREEIDAFPALPPYPALPS